jgi:DNA topoisomerase-6 subunit B
MSKRKRTKVNYAQGNTSESDQDYSDEEGISQKKSNKKAQTKSPAEFFSENQNIAGFDNPGKALYTTVREFVENSLDAAETMGRLPSVHVIVEEIGRVGLDEIRGIEPRKKKKAKTEAVAAAAAAGAAADAAASSSSSSSSSSSNKPIKSKKKTKKKVNNRSEISVFKISCKDNGMGMPHNEVPDMLGRVLSGSNYSLRQTRGKFGLGSKMALIWAKKSTGKYMGKRHEIKKQWTGRTRNKTPRQTLTPYCLFNLISFFLFLILFCLNRHAH